MSPSIKFIEWLEHLNHESTKVRAVLRRSLAFDPGAFPSAYPYVESFVKDQDNPFSWRRRVYYLVAGLWALHWREEQRGEAAHIGKACAAYYNDQKSSASIERRFITLLDADQDQLPDRLRHMISPLKEYQLDFAALLDGLLDWDSDQKRTQNRWARDFYRNITQKDDSETKTDQSKEAN